MCCPGETLRSLLKGERCCADCGTAGRMLISTASLEAQALEAQGKQLSIQLRHQPQYTAGLYGK